MPAKHPPRPMVDFRYKTNQGNIFEVVALDEQRNSLEIQYIDGCLEGLDEDIWFSLEAIPIDPPRGVITEGDGGDEGYVKLRDHARGVITEGDGGDEGYVELRDHDDREGKW